MWALQKSPPHPVLPGLVIDSICYFGRKRIGFIKCDIWHLAWNLLKWLSSLDRWCHFPQDDLYMLATWGTYPMIQALTFQSLWEEGPGLCTPERSLQVSVFRCLCCSAYFHLDQSLGRGEGQGISNTREREEFGPGPWPWNRGQNADSRGPLSLTTEEVVAAVVATPIFKLIFQRAHTLVSASKRRK